MRDPSPPIVRRVERSGDLAADERALAGIKVSHEGSFGAAISMAARASDGIVEHESHPHMEEGTAAAHAAGLDARGPHLALVLTDRRVLVYARSIFGRLRHLVWQAPLAGVDDLTVNRSGRVKVALSDGRTLSLESPRLNLKHLPDVYGGLPARFRAAKGA